MNEKGDDNTTRGQSRIQKNKGAHIPQLTALRYDVDDDGGAQLEWFDDAVSVLV